MLCRWFESIKIRAADAVTYANVLVEDGFDSTEALETMDEADLTGYGIKKGHARLILKALHK